MNEIGSSIATVVTGPMPGSTPMTVPSRTPMKQYMTFCSVSATAKPSPRLAKTSIAPRGSARARAAGRADRRTHRSRTRSAPPPARRFRPGETPAPAHAVTMVRTASVTTSPSGSIIRPNSATANAMTAIGSRCSRGTGSPSSTSERPIRSRPRPASTSAEQQREIAGPHLAGGAERIAARGQQRHRRKAAEHHPRPEVLRCANPHPHPHIALPASRSNRLRFASSMPPRRRDVWVVSRHTEMHRPRQPKRCSTIAPRSRSPLLCPSPCGRGRIRHSAHSKG